MVLNKADEYKFLHLLLDTGEMMLCSGGEVNRVENTVSLMGKAYGATETNVLVITASIVITMKFSDGNLITETRRITKSVNNRLWRLENLNAFSRKCCAEPIPVDELAKEIQMCNKPTNVWRYYLGGSLFGGAFAVFFGGNLYDGVVAAVFALLICFMKRKFSRIFPNSIVFNIVCSFICGSLILLMPNVIPHINPDKIMIGDIMLLIPGVAMTNSIRDVLIGDTISGIMRFVESLLWAGAIAVGFMLSIWMLGGII